MDVGVCCGVPRRKEDWEAEICREGRCVIVIVTDYDGSEGRTGEVSKR
jgi:hypothetical protein